MSWIPYDLDYKLDRTLQTNKLIFDLKRGAELRVQYASNPETIFARYRMSEEETRAIRDRDYEKLYYLGVHPYLLTQFARMITPNWVAAWASTKPLRMPWFKNIREIGLQAELASQQQGEDLQWAVAQRTKAQE